MKQLYCWTYFFMLIVIVFIIIFNGPSFKKSSACQCPHDVQSLVRQTARWAVASQQDTSPMISLLHANYAAGYLQALEMIATPDEINRFANLQKLRNKVYKTQDKAARLVVATCPGYIGKNVDKQLALIGISV